MGATGKYQCKKCGYNRELSIGPSGITTSFSEPYICEKIKDIVIISGNSPMVGLPWDCPPKESVPEDHQYPPVDPICPVCKDHKLGKSWDEKTCPKCGVLNHFVAEIMWD